MEGKDTRRETWHGDRLAEELASHEVNGEKRKKKAVINAPPPSPVRRLYNAVITPVRWARSTCPDVVFPVEHYC